MTRRNSKKNICSTMSHDKVLALSKLYKEGSTTDCDDRVAAVSNFKSKRIFR